jgi:hydrogenase expression/formation protein HypC
MCLAVPAKIMSIEKGIARVDISGNAVDADISLITDAAVGDYVIVHSGMAIEKYEPEEALRTLALFREMAESGVLQ